jgi:hypothetical protein
MVRGATKGLAIDIGFLLEGRSMDELPETLLGAFRWVARAAALSRQRMWACAQPAAALYPEATRNTPRQLQAGECVNRCI